MASESKSVQEREIRKAIEHSMAAPFVFLADEWKKKSGNNREPADLVWFCNGVAILMYMCTRKDYGHPVKDARKCQETIDHNLRQSEGWMKEWSAGRPLIGSNEFRRFEVRRQDARHVIVLSIVESAADIAEFYDERAKDLGVTACVTLPHKFITTLIEFGGSTLDLVHLIRSLKNRGRLSQQEGVALLHRFRKNCCIAGGINLLWPSGKFDSRFYEVSQLVDDVRSQKPKLPSLGDQLDSYIENCRAPVGEILTDLHLLEYYRIVGELRVMIDHARQELARGLPTVLEKVVELSHHDLGLCVFPGFVHSKVDMSPYIMSMINTWIQREESGQIRHGPRLMVDSFAKLGKWMMFERRAPSHLELFMMNWEEPFMPGESAF
jgi:hypothetical protein